MMSKVAENWNEVLQMAEQDLEDATYHIRDLEADIARKAKQMQATSTRVIQQQTHIQEMEEKWKDVEENQASAFQQNQDLAVEVDSLRKQLAKSQGRVSDTKGRYKVYKEKINQAIAEQQELYKRSKTYYDNILHELKAEEEKQAVKSTEVDNALQVSQKKREEMSKAFHEFQDSTRRQVEQKDREIATLTTKMQQQNEELLEKMNESERLRIELDQAQDGNNKAALELHGKLDALTELSQTAGEQGKKQASDMELLSDRLNSACESLEERIVQRLLPSLSTVLTHQVDTQSTMYRFSKSFESELLGVKDAMQHYVLKKMDNPDQEQTIRDIDERLQNLQEEMWSTRDTCGNMQEQFQGWAGREMDASKEAHITREDDLLRQFQDRYQSLDSREQQLQVLMGKYASKMEQLYNSRASEEEIEKAVNHAGNLFKDTLDANLLKERDWLSQKFQQNGTAILSLQEHLRTATMRDKSNIEGLSKDLEGERATVARLTNDVQRLQQEASVSAELRERWTQDIQQIDSLRTKLSAAHCRMPRVEGIAAKLDHINHLNGMIHSTSSYLSREKSWIKNELDATAEGDAPCDSDGFQGKTLIQGDRRVHVRSPWQDRETPSPPPSIEQEKRRRKEAAAKPRSILKSSGTVPSSQSIDGEMSQSQGGEMSQAQGAPVHERPMMSSYHSDYNRSVVPEPAPDGVRGTESHGYIGKIRNMFTATVRNITTYAEFESNEASKKGKSHQSHFSEGHRSSVPTENIHKISERFTSLKDTSPDDLRIARHTLKRTAPNTADLSRPRVKKQYGRGKSE